MRLRRSAPLVAALPAFLAACAAPSADARRRPGEAPLPVRHSLPAGTTVTVLAPTASGAVRATPPPALHGWLREALRQSSRLDFGDEAPAEGGVVLETHVDLRARSVTTALRLPDRAPIALATVEGLGPGDVDRLAAATRAALGDRPAGSVLPVARIYSSSPVCVRHTEAARAALRRGDRRGALAALERARPADPGCTFALAALAATSLDLGDPARARRIAYEGLLLESRLSPTTRHRLARTLLLARATEPGRAAEADRELLRLAEATLRERPHDPHPLYSRALATNFLRRFDVALPLLRRLRARWPGRAAVAYHLCFAALATGEAALALRAIEAARARLPLVHVVVPRALALWANGRQAELRTWLAELARDRAVASTPLLHEVLRMRAAVALLTDREAEAARWLLEDVEWIRRRPSRLEERTMDLVEAGQVLVRIGRHLELRTALAAFEERRDLPPTLRQALVFLEGLIAVAVTGKAPEVAEADLRHQGQRVWAAVLAAAAHRARGELMDEMRERVLAYQSTEEPLVRAELARTLRAAGDERDAGEVLERLRRRLLRVDLRDLRSHPLVSPGAALAYLATTQ